MAEKTMEELSTELGELNNQVKTLKEHRQELVRDYKETGTRLDEMKAQIQVINLQIKSMKSEEKISKKGAHLAELMRAKEAAEKLGVRVTGRKKAENSMPMAAAAHHSTGEVEDPLAGNLTDTVDINDLEKELDIF
jgi:septal ring factor EnvC (AmiA/AmiB activator)